MSGSAAIDDLVQQGKIAPGDQLILARVGVGVAVRAGAAKPDISSIEAFRRTLLAKVLDRLGIAKEIKAKSILNARAATTPSAEIVARGEAELGIQLISEIVSVPGAELLGPLPDDLQAMNVIFAGIVTTGSEPDAARVLFKFLTSPAAAALIKATGMEPGGYDGCDCRLISCNSSLLSRNSRNAHSESSTSSRTAATLVHGPIRARSSPKTVKLEAVIGMRRSDRSRRDRKHNSRSWSKIVSGGSK